MQESTFSYDLDGYQVDITVKRATLAVGAIRTRLLRLIDTVMGESRDEVDAWLWRVFSDITAATVSVVNRDGAECQVPWDSSRPLSLAKTVNAEKLPISFADFLELPEELFDTWQEAVHELNSHWVPWRKVTPEKGEDGLELGESEGGESPPSNES